MDAADLKKRRDDDQSADEEEEGEEDPRLDEPVPEMVGDVKTHKIRALADLLKEMGNFTTKAPGDNTSFQIAVQGLNMDVYYDEALGVKSPTKTPGGFDSQFVISKWFDDKDDNDADDGDGDGQTTTTAAEPEWVLPDWLSDAVDRKVYVLHPASKMKAASSQIEVPPATDDGQGPLESVAEYVATLSDYCVSVLCLASDLVACELRRLSLGVIVTEVFNSGTPRSDIFSQLDGLSRKAHDMEIKGIFPQKEDIAILKHMHQVAFDCYPPNSLFIGVPECMLGRVVHCLCGKRCYFGIAFGVIFNHYQESFGEDCYGL